MYICVYVSTIHQLWDTMDVRLLVFRGKDLCEPKDKTTSVLKKADVSPR